MLAHMDPAQRVLLRYTNHRGRRTTPSVLPQRLYFGTSEFHPEPQWLLDAWDLDTQALRTYAMRDIEFWMPPKPDQGDAS